MERVSYFINLFGGKAEWFNLFLLMTVLIIINAAIKNRLFRLLFALLSACFFSLQVCSLYFTKKFIGYPFYIHFNTRDISELAHVYNIHLFGLVLIGVLLMTLFYLSGSFKLKAGRYDFHVKFAIALFSLIFMCFNGGLIHRSVELVRLLSPNTDTKNFHEHLKEIGIKDYTLPADLEVIQGKNIVVISLESLERGFLSEKFAHLTPNLRQLKNDWTYYDIQQNSGSGWTSGSLYTYLTGMPAYFGIEGNFIFHSAYHSDITGIGHVLKKADYKTTFLTENARYAGTQYMLNILQIDDIIDKSILRNSARDKDLFDKAKSKIQSYKSENEHFALFMATLDTHFPDGIYDARMEDYVPPQKTKLGFMISAVDYMIGDFINFLEEENLLSNTIVYIFPDHLKMGDATIFKETGKRSLYLITNAEKQATDTSLYQIDLPKMILEGAEVKSNAKFLTDYISGNKNQFILDHINKLTAINTSGLLRMQNKQFVAPKPSEHYDKYKRDTSRFIAHAGGMIAGKIYTNSLEALNLNYDKGLRLFELDIMETSDGKFVAAHGWDDWRDMTGYEGSLPVTHQEFLQHKIYDIYTPMDMTAINEWFGQHPDAILVTDKINEPRRFSEAFIDKNRLMMELFTLEAVKEGIATNIKSAMPAQVVIQNLKGNKVEQLQQLGVKNIIVSRRFIASNIDFLQQLKDRKVETYVYKINTYTGKDEDYVVKYEMDYIYGIYTDEWSFETK